MRFVIFSALYRPSIGGVENFTDHVAHELAAMGHTITVVTSNISQAPEYEREDDVSIVRLPCRNLLKGRLPVARRDGATRRILDRLKCDGCDGVLINTRFYPHSLIGARFARTMGVTPVVLDHGSDYLTLGNPLIDKVIQRYEHIITSRLKTYSPMFYGVSRKSCEWLSTFDIEARGVIPNAIDAAAYRTSASTRNIRSELDIDSTDLLVAFVGRLVSEKGVTQLVEAQRLLTKMQAPCTLVIAGDGPLKEQLASNLPACTHLVGALAPKDVSRLLLEADVLCLPSRSEGFAAVLLEAAACGTPSIATHVGVAPELISSPSFGTLLDDNSPTHIAETISRYINDRQLARQQGKQVQQRAEQSYTWHAAALALQQAFIDAQLRSHAATNQH